MQTNVRERLVLPVLIPLSVVLVVAFVTVNISRLFLATAGAVAVGIATGLTITVLLAFTFFSQSVRVRSSTVSVVAAASVALVLAAGLTALGASEEHEEEGGGVADVPADAVITAEAGNFFINLSPEVGPPGVIEFDYVNTEPGRHTLLIEEDPSFAKLDIDGEGATDSGKAELETGSYTLFCDIPGHRAQGMETTFTVEEGAPTVGGDEAEGTGAEPGGTPEDEPGTGGVAGETDPQSEADQGESPAQPSAEPPATAQN